MTELNKIAILQKTLQSLQPLKAEDQQRLDKKFRMEFNFNTNHIEGNTLTYSETELLLIFDEAKGEHTLREFEEAKGGDVAFQLIKDWAKENERPLSEQHIKNLNQILLVRPFWKEAITPDGQATRRLIKVGEYKEHPNSVRLQNGEIFQYASPMDTPIEMKELIKWYRTEEEKKELHPIVLAAMLHYKFVLIHPFDDGNGRVSRLLMNYVMFKNNLPPVIIKSEDKQNYLRALNRADTGDLESFVSYIALRLIWSLELSIKAARGESIDEPGDLDKKLKLLKQKLQISGDAVKVTKSKEAILHIIESSLELLFERLSSKFSEFSIFFKKTIFYISANNHNLGEDLNTGLYFIKQELLTSPIENIIIQYLFGEFRKKNIIAGINLSLYFQFHQNVYEINSNNMQFQISKLYNEDLTEIEINQIVEQLGTYIHNQIEEAIKESEK